MISEPTGRPPGSSHDRIEHTHPVRDRNAPRGALAFFRFFRSAAGAPGHVAISFGDGRMISTDDGRTRGVHVMPIAAYDPARYLGRVGV